MAEAELLEVVFLVLDDIVEDFELTDPEVYELLISEETANQMTSAITTVIDAGGTDSEALGDTYNVLAGISEEAADEWAEGMIDQGYEVGGDPGQAEEADFGDTDPDSDPNKGEVEGCDDILALAGTDPDPQCTVQKQEKLSRFQKFLLNNVGTFVVIILGTIAYLIGTIGRAICRLINARACNPPPSGETQEQCLDERCNTPICNGVTKLIQFLRRYFNIIMAVLVVLMIIFTVYFRSTKPLILFGILILIVLVLNTLLGNLVATVVCNLSATACLVTGQSINC